MGQQETTATRAANTYPVERSHTEVHGFAVTHCKHSTPGYWQGELIWVGYGPEGMWLTAEQARKVADTILLAASAAARQQAVQVAA